MKVKHAKIIGVVVIAAVIIIMTVLGISSSLKKPDIIMEREFLLTQSSSGYLYPDYERNCTKVVVNYDYEIIDGKLRVNNYDGAGYEKFNIPCSECEELFYFYGGDGIDLGDFGGIILQLTRCSDGSERFIVKDIITVEEKNQYQRY